MLSPEIIKKIKKLHIKSGRTVNTMMAGQYKSVFRGSGIEFEEVREYAAGDDVKNIDWKVSARLGKPFIKLYREERELVVMLLIDMSASGFFGTSENVKQETIAEVASILAFNAIRNNDKVGAILFTDQVEKYIPPKKGTAHVFRVIKEIFAFVPARRKTDIKSAVSYLGRVYQKKTVCFMISDFITPSLISATPKGRVSEDIRNIKIISKKHELIGILISDPGDFTLPQKGILTGYDLETGRICHIDASHSKTRKHFEQTKLMQYKTVLTHFRTADIDCVEISTKGSVIDPLIKYFRFREQRMK